jgi:hypothetical protein
VIALVERAQCDHLGRHAHDQRAEEPGRDAKQIGAAPLGDRNGEVRADHIERAVRQVHHVHDAQHQRQSRGQQEKHHAQLNTVQQLLEDER